MASPLDVVTLPTPAGVETKQVLHLGMSVCTPAKLHPSFVGWHEVRIDTDASVNPDFVASPVNMSKIKTASMDAVYSFRSLQLLHAHDVPLGLSEIRRVLKPSGYALVGVIDLAKMAAYLNADRLDEMVYDSGSGPVSVLDLLFGNRALIAQGKLVLANHTGFTVKSLGAAWVKAGFSDVRVQPVGLDVWVHAVKGTVPATSFTLLDPPATPGEPEPNP